MEGNDVEEKKKGEIDSLVVIILSYWQHSLNHPYIVSMITLGLKHLQNHNKIQTIL